MFLGVVAYWSCSPSLNELALIKCIRLCKMRIYKNGRRQPFSRHLNRKGPQDVGTYEIPDWSNIIPSTKYCESRSTASCANENG